LLLLLALVLGALAASWYFTSRDETVDAERVPDVVGLERAEGERRVRERGFEIQITQVESPRPAGTVIAQQPDPGTVYGEGGIVALTVAGSSILIAVPDVTGLRSAPAQARLRAAGFRPRAETISSRRPRGQVVRQIPAAGTDVPRGSAVVVIVSAGRQLVEVPSVTGLTADEATAELTRAGFRTRITRVPGAEAEGTVIGQGPAAGSRAPRGGVVRINVSRGQTQTTTTVVTTTTTPARASVPDTVGQDEATAISTIEGAGFRVRVVERSVADPAQDGIVISQSPQGGSSAARDSTVTVIVGRLR
jgi:serine/threonine-protein kinase